MNFTFQLEDTPGFPTQFTPDRHPGIIGNQDFILLRAVTYSEGRIQGVTNDVKL